MWTLLLLLSISQVFGQAPNLKPSPLDDELKSMSEELDNMGDDKQQKVAIPVPADPLPAQQQVKPAEHEMHEKQVSGPQMTQSDVLRYVQVDAGEQMAIVQGNVLPKIIATAPGDRFAVLPVVKKTTPCPTTTSRKPKKHIFCQSCGKKNPKEQGLLTSYIDVTNSQECAQLCARYITKGKGCSVWEYHGEWRNRQCFLLKIDDFPMCQGQLGVGSNEAFESGTCVMETFNPGQKPKGLELSNSKMTADGLPATFPHAQVASSLFESDKFIVPAAVGSLIIFAGVFYYASRKTRAEYVALPEEL